MSDTVSNQRVALQGRFSRTKLLVLIGVTLLLVPLGPESARADHPCSTDPNSSEYDPLCEQEGEMNCNPLVSSSCLECWDCIDNDGDGLFDCMDNLDAEGNDSTNHPQSWMNGGCAEYCTFINPAGSGAYDQDQDDDGFLACPLGPPEPAPPIYDCDDRAPVCSEPTGDDDDSATGDDDDSAVAFASHDNQSDCTEAGGTWDLRGSTINSGATEDCADGIDNDCDELVDAADPDCTGDDDDSAASGDDDTTGDDDSAASGDDDTTGDDDSAASGDDDDDTSGDEGCSCSSAQSATHTGLGLALLAGLVGFGLWRRRTKPIDMPW